METNFEWYQLVVAYTIGAVWIFGWNKITKELHKMIELHPYVFTLMYATSVILGNFWFAADSPSVRENSNVYLDIWHLLSTRPWDLLVELIVLNVFFVMFAFLPMIGMLLVYILFKYIQKPELFYRE